MSHAYVCVYEHCMYNPPDVLFSIIILIIIQARYIRLSEKFLSFYEEIIDAQGFLFPNLNLANIFLSFHFILPSKYFGNSSLAIFL